MARQLLLVVCLLQMFLNVNATEYSNFVDEQLSLQGFDASTVDTGILMDRTLEFVDSQIFDGSDTAPPATIEQLREVKRQIESASYSGNPFNRLSSGPTIQKVTTGDVSNVININLVIAETQRTIGSTNGTYLEIGIIGISAPDVGFTYYGKEVKFILQEKNISSTLPRSELDPNAYEIDFDDGNGFRVLPVGQEITVSYSTDGIKNIVMKSLLYNTQDGYPYAYLTTKSTFDVKYLSSPQPVQKWNIIAEKLYGSSLYGTGDALLYTTDENYTIDQPIIITDGFDPDDELKQDGLYDLLNQKLFITDMVNLGWDIIVVNFHDGAGLIQKNAFVVEEVIHKVNQVKKGTMPIILVGPSMGGLVTKYALLDMETNKENHNVALWVSFDSPHTGANIPAGVQAFLSYWADDSSGAAAGLEKIRQIAALQMLNVQLIEKQIVTTTEDPDTGEITTTSRQVITQGIEKGSPLRTELLAEFSDMGSYPKQMRKIAVSNGSAMSTYQGFNEGDVLLHMEQTKKRIGLGCKPVVKSKIYATSQGSDNGYFWARIDCGIIQARGPFRAKSYIDLELDHVPGGTHNTPEILAKGQSGMNVVHGRASFIPTTSAFGIDTNDYFYDIANDPEILNKTPFDAIYYPEEFDMNQNHIDITEEIKSNLLNEFESVKNIHQFIVAMPAINMLLLN